MMDVELLVEGVTDEIFLRKVLSDLHIGVRAVYGKRGCAYIIEKGSGFAARGEYSGIIILADLCDVHRGCPLLARRRIAEQVPELCLLRFAVCELESWLLASRVGLSQYFGISAQLVPATPDELLDPKQVLVNLARRSRRRRIREMFVPPHGTSSDVGRGYVEGISEFMSNHWDMYEARASSPSFERFVVRVRERFVLE